MNVISLDTGGTTGIATWRGDTLDAGEHVAWDLPAGEAMQWLGEELAKDRWDPWHLVICEAIRIGPTSPSSILVSIEQIGVARYLSHCYGADFDAKQTPGEAKGFATDKKLRAVDWWTKGSDHARDASRHLLTHLCKRDAAIAAELASRVA